MVIHLVKVSPKNGKFFEQLDVLVCAKKNAEDDVRWFEPWTVLDDRVFGPCATGLSTSDCKYTSVTNVNGKT